MMKTSAVIAAVSPACSAHAASGEMVPGPGLAPPAPGTEIVPVLIIPVGPAVVLVDWVMTPVAALEPFTPTCLGGSLFPPQLAAKVAAIATRTTKRLADGGRQKWLMVVPSFSPEP